MWDWASRLWGTLGYHLKHVGLASQLWGTLGLHLNHVGLTQALVPHIDDAILLSMVTYSLEEI